MSNTKDNEEQNPTYTTSIPKIKKMPANLVAVYHIKHQVMNDQPDYIECKLGRALTSDSYPFIIPRLKLTQEWKKIDSSWIEKDKCSMLLLCNNEGKNFTKIPTQEELESISKRVVEIGILTTYLAPSVEELSRSAIEEKGLNVWEKMERKNIPQPKPRVEITPIFYIPPGEKHPFSPIDLSLLFFRCREGEANCSVRFYPN